MCYLLDDVDNIHDKDHVFCYLSKRLFLLPRALILLAVSTPLYIIKITLVSVNKLKHLQLFSFQKIILLGLFKMFNNNTPHKIFFKQNLCTRTAYVRRGVMMI